MTLWNLIEVIDRTLPLYVRYLIEDSWDFYKNADEFIDKNEIGVYGRKYSFDEDTVRYITIEDGVLTIVLLEGELNDETC